MVHNTYFIHVQFCKRALSETFLYKEETQMVPS